METSRLREREEQWHVEEWKLGRCAWQIEAKKKRARESEREREMRKGRRGSQWHVETIK